MNFRVCALLLGIAFGSCSGGSTNEDIARKKIKQHIEVAGMGAVKNIKIDSFVKIDETTYFARHHFKNPMIDKNVRISRVYSFPIALDSILKIEDVAFEMESEGEWVKTNW